MGAATTALTMSLLATHESPQAAAKGSCAGYASVFAIALSTVLSTQLTRLAQDGFHAPFFVMYVHIGLMALWLPAAHALARGERYIARARDVWVFLPLWVVSNYCLVRGLALAPAGLVQTLFGTAPAQVALLSRICLGEEFTPMRAGAVLLAAAGTASVGSGHWSNGRGGMETFIGGSYALGAVFASAAYKVLFKVRLGEPPLHAVLGFVGTLGFVASVLGLPIAWALAAGGLEDCWWDGSVPVNWIAVLGSAAIDVVYNTSMAYGLASASPVFISVGLILGTPANLTIDALASGHQVGPADIIGASLIIASFAALAVGNGKRPTLSQLQEPACINT